VLKHANILPYPFKGDWHVTCRVLPAAGPGRRGGAEVRRPCIASGGAAGVCVVSLQGKAHCAVSRLHIVSSQFVMQTYILRMPEMQMPKPGCWYMQDSHNSSKC
jgi:hypothetical protein